MFLYIILAEYNNLGYRMWYTPQLYNLYIQKFKHRYMTTCMCKQLKHLRPVSFNSGSCLVHQHHTHIKIYIIFPIIKFEREYMDLYREYWECLHRNMYDRLLCIIDVETSVTFWNVKNYLFSSKIFQKIN